MVVFCLYGLFNLYLQKLMFMIENLEYKISLNDVENFLIGHGDEQYIVNLEYDQKTNLIYKFKQLPDGQKTIETEPLKAFLWMKNLGELKKKVNFYGCNDVKIKSARREYGIEITQLRHDEHPRLENGYKYLVTCDQGYTRLLDFFKKGGFYDGLWSLRHNIKDHFIILSPIEQYLISTGNRLFKGYEDYNDLEKFVFDLETTGLDPKTSRIFLIGCKTNKGFEELYDVDLDCDDVDQSERDAIIKFFNTIDNIKPTTIAGYNSFNFDWDFFYKRCDILGLDITAIAKTLSDDKKINLKDTILKLGNEIEDYKQVNMFGYSIIDIIHASRRAQAIDSSMKQASLKYVCKYNKVAKKNRVYIKGDKIGSLWVDQNKYYFDDVTGEYSLKKPTITFTDEFITRDILINNRDKIYVFGDNDLREGYGGQAKEMRGEPNSIGIPTKKKPTNAQDAFYTDDEYESNKNKINFVISKIINHIKKGYDIVIPNGIGTGLSKLNLLAPKTYDFLISSLKALDKYVKNSWVEVNGKYIVKRYLMDDLWETLEVDNIYNQSSFMLAKTIPTNYQKVSTMGTAGLWKLLMFTWSYENGLAIPINDVKRDFVGGLSRLLKVGYSVNLRKMDFNSLYPAIQLAHNVFPTTDISGVMKSLLKYFHSERFKAKTLAKKYGKEGNKQLENLYKRKQLPIKIFINAMFGALGAPNAFNWAEMDVAEGITCRARQYLRLMTKFFMSKGYIPTVMDTDGINFMAPQDLDESKFKYVGKGNNSEVVADKEYTGVNAVVAEFNDIFMVGEMALGLDGQWDSTINLARKNYALLEDDGSVSLTGNSIKSKSLPIYIEEFLDKGLLLLLNNKGYEFVQFYYDYIDKIYNKQIPLSKIATKAKVKKTVNDYINRGTNKNGAPLSRQAHMELIIKDGVNVNLGDVVYYVNNGLKKTDTDTKRTKKCKLKAKEIKEYIEKHNKKPGDEYYDITETLNCYLINEKDINDDPNKLGDYNVHKYIDSFNSRLKGLMVCFPKDVRDKILITSPEQKVNTWSISELELVNGEPINEKNQDTLEELFTPSDLEVTYWNKINYNPSIWFNNEVIFTLPGLNKTVKI